MYHSWPPYALCCCIIIYISQLAADAGNTIAMTDDEKKRLADILENLDGIDENLPDTSEDIPFRVAVRPGMHEQ